MNTDRSPISAPTLLQWQHYQPIQIAWSQAGITQWWRYLRTRWGGERLRECLGSDKVERGYWQRYAGLAEGDIKRRGLGGRLTQFLSLTQWTGMSGRMTNPKTSQRTQHTRTHTQFIHTLRTGAHFITSSSLYHIASQQPAICSLFTSRSLVSAPLCPLASLSLSVILH